MKDSRNGIITAKKVNERKVLQECYESVTFLFLLFWCFLPVLMSVFNMFMGATGRLFSDESIQEAAQSYNLGINYLLPVNAYRKLFVIFGLITLAWAVICVLFSWRRIADRDSLKKSPWFYILLSLFVWALVCSLMSDDLLRAFFGNSMLFDGLFSYMIYGAVFICASMIRTEARRKALLRCFSVMAVLTAIIMLMAEGGNAFLRACMPSKRAVVFIQFNHFGYVLCMGIMALAGLYLFDRKAKKGIKGVYLIALGVLVQALLVNDTFGCYVAVVVAIPVIYLFYGLSGSRIRFAALLPVLVFIGISAINYLGIGQQSSALSGNVAQLGTDIQNIATGSEAAAQAGTLRFVKWMDTIKRIGERPIFGFGPEGFYGANAITESDAPHNEYLQIAGYLGIPGLLLYLSALVSLAVHHFRNIKRLDPMVLAVSGVSVGYLISASFGVPVFNTAPFLWIFLGLTTAVGEAEEPLVCPNRAEVAALFSDKRRKERTIIAIAGTLLLIAIIIIRSFMAIEDEHLYEFADLQAMRGADLTAQADYMHGWLLEEGEYWYDADRYRLVPADQPKPEPYGLGRSAVGNTWYEFSKKNGIIYDYDESTDYRDKIICLTAAWDADGNLQTYVRWVEAG